MIKQTGSLQGEIAEHLYKHLLDNYDIMSRPTANESMPVIVTIGLTIQQIVDVVRGIQITQFQLAQLAIATYNNLPLLSGRNSHPNAALQRFWS